MKVFIVGSGKLAQALLPPNLLIEACEIVKWDESSLLFNEKSLVVHAGSGRQLKECVDFCKRTKSIFIELSTGLDTENIEPEFPLIVCPNTSILVLKAMHMLNITGDSFKNYNISITESHQSSKVTEPGTAYAFADSLSFESSKIVSVRDAEIQKQHIGIPEEYLNKHAYHKIIISDGNDEITLETKVLGHDSYTKGVRVIIQTLIKANLVNKKYSVLDLVEKGML